MSLQFLTSFPEMWREGVPHLFLGSWRRFYFVPARSLLPFDGRSILYNLYNESVYTESLTRLYRHRHVRARNSRPASTDEGISGAKSSADRRSDSSKTGGARS